MLYDLLDINKLNGSEDCISIYNQQLVIMKWNPACEKAFRIEASKAVRSNLLDLFPQVKNDYRITCLRDSATSGKSFFFTSMPYEFSDGFYSQLILPMRDNSRAIWGTINIIHHHQTAAERYSRSDLLNPLLKDEVLLAHLFA